MTWRRTLVLVLAIDLLTLAALAFFLSRQGLALEEREFIGLRSLFPAGPARPLDLGAWKGVELPGRFRVLRSSCSEEVDLEALLRRSFSRPYLLAPVSLGDRGLYGLRRRGKGYVAGAVFLLGDTLYWLDVNSFHSTLDHRRRVFDDCLLHLRVAGRPPAPRLAAELRAIAGRISPFFMQSVGQLLVFLAAIFLVVWAVLWLVMRLSGAPPAAADTSSLCTPHQTMVWRGFGRKSSPCCLCLEEGQIVAYRFRREVARIDIRKSRGDLRMENRRLRVGSYLFVLDAEAFDRWRIYCG